MINKLKNKIIDTKFPLIIELIKWKIIDIKRNIKNKDKKIHLYGIWLICGLYGMGKTMYLSYYLDSMRKKYGDKIYICTNYYFKKQDFPMEDWKMLLKEYDKPIIFGFDEIQNEFNSRNYQNFPTELLTMLTQNRKGHGKMVVGTAQRFVRVDKIFRELCTHICECRTRFGRLTSVKIFDLEDYEMFINQTDINRKMRIKPKDRKIFVQTDDIRNCYDSYQMLDSAKNKEYISKKERAIIEQLI